MVENVTQCSRCEGVRRVFMQALAGQLDRQYLVRVVGVALKPLPRRRLLTTAVVLLATVLHKTLRLVWTILRQRDCCQCVAGSAEGAAHASPLILSINTLASAKRLLQHTPILTRPCQ